ncbi:hypothetical protein D6C89_10250 [Aureobasidium pullulans]|nr:hypothetical protein D6C89_10250 [Aureobasidium pullulans]
MNTADLNKFLPLRRSRHSPRVFADGHDVEFTRLSPTLVGSSGRTYSRKELLHTNPECPQLHMYIAVSENKRYVLKPVPPSIFDFLQEVKDTFRSDSRLRTHINQNDENLTLVYEYFKTNLLALIKNY